jgi:hypothetical protein
MALSIFGALNDIVNKTAAAVVDSQIFPKSADIVNAFVKASFDAADSVVSQIRDITKPAPTAPNPGP